MSVSAMTLTSEVVLSIPITWLPKGGTIMRIACGRTIRRMICDGRMPSDRAASTCPISTEASPARMISVM